MLVVYFLGAIRKQWDFFKCLFLFIYVAVLSLSCGMQDLCSSLWHVGSSSLTRTEPRPPALGTQSLIHWTKIWLLNMGGFDCLECELNIP